MPMISYAQNAEDVLLRRLFPPGHRGFYIDVGANDPVLYSVTKFFYESGWRGINVEPLAEPWRRLAADRARDVNLNAGLSDREGEATFYEVPARAAWPGLSTFSPLVAQGYERMGLALAPRTVPVTTLARVCEEHAPAEIDFLSIDVEGHERAVLLGNDWHRWRPRAVVVEATYPTTSRPTYGLWEPLLLQAGYLFACFDGLNRYYLRDEDRALLPRLAVPANHFDDYIPYIYHARIQELEEQLAEARASYDALARTLGRG